MTLPGFIEKTHLSNAKGRHHETTSFRSRSAERIIPAQSGAHWGSFKRDHCIEGPLPGGIGKRQYSSILWDIPWGENWEAACRNTIAYVEGHYFRGATRCVNTGFNIWGEFDVPDQSCGYCWYPPSCQCCWDPWNGEECICSTTSDLHTG